MPQNLLLADVNADGASDFLQYARNTLFASNTDFEKTGFLHLYLNRPIKRVLTGDFHGDHYDQVCAVTDDNALQCFGIGADRHELWWWFTQGTSSAMLRTRSWPISMATVARTFSCIHFGWSHSFDDTNRKNADWSAPGEYLDYWDIMSAMAVHSFAHPQAIVAGPELNARNRSRAC